MTERTRILEPAEHAAERRLPGLKLIVIEGPDRGAEIRAQRGVVRVGSAADNDLVLTDGAASRHHLEVRIHGAETRVRDLGSTNGTRIDGVRVFDALLDPASLIRLGETSLRATLLDEVVVVPLSTRTSMGRLRGASAAMREVYAVLERAAPTNVTVLIDGETGTGKELAAEALHEHSSRADGPYVTFDCAAVSPNLIESALFGHIKGAFTGATHDQRGAVESADKGTLFLDEIGELPLDLQPKLLRLLENREVRRIGESHARKVDVRVVAATHRDLEAQVNRGAFREDLFYRLAVVRVTMPPLRARKEDIPLLVAHIVKACAPDAPAPSPEITNALAQRAWPGNVRQLRNEVERAMALGLAAGTAPATASNDTDENGLLRSVLDAPYKEALDRWCARFDERYLERVLERSGGSVTEAAKLADVSRKHIHRMIARTRGGDPDDVANDE